MSANVALACLLLASCGYPDPGGDGADAASERVAVSFAMPRVTTGEAGTDMIRLTFDRPVLEDTSVAYTIGGTASHPGDHALVAGTMMIPQSAVQFSLPVSVVADALDEDDETIEIDLTDPGPGLVLGAVHTTIVTILDDDPPPVAALEGFTSGDVEGNSGLMTIRRDVVLDAPSGKTVTVPFTPGGTATVGTDYTISASPVTFAPGEVRVSIVLTVIGDGQVEPDEVLTVLFGTPTNATWSGPFDWQHTINNDD